MMSEQLNHAHKVSSAKLKGGRLYLANSDGWIKGTAVEVEP